MKKIIYVAISILILSCSKDDTNQEKNPNTPTTDFKLKKIYSSSTDFYEYFYKGNDLSYTVETEGGTSYKNEFLYDSETVKSVKYYINNTHNSSYDVSYVYSGSKITSSSGYDGSTDLYTNQYIYNPNNKVIEEKQLKNNIYECSSFYSYFSNGNIQTKSFSGTTNVVNYLYDDKINPEFYAYNTALVSITELAKNNIIQDKYYKYSYDYNLKNLPIKKYTYNLSSNVLLKTEFYEYY